ncbi:MAG TPA: hypothetical protein VK960_01110 [Acidimicrobiia bacterium]|nr:hypothetical protein [Acidimicrobiia bacterium]
MREISFVLAFALVIGACGGTSTGDSAASTSSSAATTTRPSTTAAPGTTGAPGTTSTPAETSTTRTPPDGDPAPDFTLALGDGGTFTLSEEQKPVYMIFWAEW